MISFISSFEFLNIVVREAKSDGRQAKSKGRHPVPNIFLWIAASVADDATGNTNGIKNRLASGLSTFFNKGNPVFSNGPNSLPENPPHCPILCNWVFDHFILAGTLFPKALKRFDLCIS